MLAGAPIAVDFADLGRLLLPPDGNNPQSPLPDCVSLRAFYELKNRRSKSAHKDLFVYLKLGAQAFKIAGKGDNGEDRVLKFAVELRHANLELIAQEGVQIDESSVLGVSAAVPTAKVKSRVTLDKNAGNSHKIEGGIDATASTKKGIFGSVTGGIGGKATGSRHTDARVEITSDTLHQFVTYAPANNLRWQMTPNISLRDYDVQQVKRTLEGVYLSKKAGQLFTFKEAQKSFDATLVLGVTASLDNIEITLDEHNDNDWWQKHLKSEGFKDHRELAKILIREYLTKKIGDNMRPGHSTDRLFFAIAAATPNDF